MSSAGFFDNNDTKILGKDETVIGNVGERLKNDSAPTAFFIKQDTSITNSIFIGKTEDHTALESEAKWQVSRMIASGFVTTTEFANNGSFDQIWDNRTSLFSAPTFVNTHSIQFDGSNDRISFSHSSNYDFDKDDAFSLSWWAKSIDSTKTYMEKMTTNTGYRARIVNGRLTLEFRATGTGDRIRVRTSSVLTEHDDGSWHHYVITKNNTSNASGVKIYVDGVSQVVQIQNDTLVGSPLNGDELAIAARSGGGDYFGGNLDNPSVCDVELTQTEITAIYNSGSPVDLFIVGNPSALVFWATFNNIVFPIVPDSASGIDGTMINMVTGSIETEVP